MPWISLKNQIENWNSNKNEINQQSIACNRPNQWEVINYRILNSVFWLFVLCGAISDRSFRLEIQNRKIHKYSCRSPITKWFSIQYRNVEHLTQSIRTALTSFKWVIGQKNANTDGEILIYDWSGHCIHVHFNDFIKAWPHDMAHRFCKVEWSWIRDAQSIGISNLNAIILVWQHSSWLYAEIVWWQYFTSI